MNGRRLERGRLAGEQRMLPTGVALQNAPGKPELTAARIGAYLAACGGYRDLQAPAAAEERNAGGQDRPGGGDLAGHGGAPRVDVEGRSRHGDAPVTLPGDSPPQSSALPAGPGGRLASDDRGLIGADSYAGQRMRYSKVAAHLEHPVEEAIEAGRRQVEHARDDIGLVLNRASVERHDIGKNDRIGQPVVGVEP